MQISLPPQIVVKAAQFVTKAISVFRGLRRLLAAFWLTFSLLLNALQSA
ncbi:hypothetical protein TRICHSKD4_5702 [Roseibium sp. TrichSKD4]|nr:hypothetical protein TRICHSKD4_5702 [Roseibium sp. TrichSKD4]